MTYHLTIDNPNGSSSTIEVERVFSKMFNYFRWDWQELSPKVLEDDCIDRVEEAILEALGEADDMSEETSQQRMKYWNKKFNTVESIDRVVSQYFNYPLLPKDLP